MKWMALLIGSAALAASAQAATLDELKDRYRELCLHEAGGDMMGPKLCKCLVKKIDKSASEDQLPLIYAVLVADDEDLDDAAAAAETGLTVENYVTLRDQTRDMETSQRKACSKEVK
ncbi:hypothetical protein sos41_17710 [Alphaproteobacteria bacterium SO-S41]|nr:hypothetical protein sos41_17710 [Alphaproteobacteria bacterium SO-S41]